MDEFNKTRSLQPDHADSERDAKDGDGKRGQADQSAKEKLDDALDLALEESFPGSDPISIAQPPQSVYDKNDEKKR
jgi:hypothetical protein